MKMRRLSAVLLLTGLAAQAQTLRLIEAARGFQSPVGIEFEEASPQRMFVVEKAGRIRIVSGGRVLPTSFLDISGLVARGDEQGLLGLALPPNFATKKYFYVNYTRANGDTIIARYRVSASDPNLADPASQEVIVEIDQPAANHNGGQIRFGPDGYLYIGMGDGGGGNDTFQNAQNRQSLLGKILRIDVENVQKPYGIPPTNPFVNDASYRPEIWAMGVRNPWRFSFDRVTGDLWIADVGQDRSEEINLQPADSKGGENYGWPTMEGFQCLTGSNCDRTGLTLPVFQYPHVQGNISITGAFAYRGPSAALPPGGYIYGDFGSGRIWWLEAVNGSPGQYVSRVLRDPGFNISTFGEDSSGNVFVANVSEGVISRLDFITARSAASPSYARWIVPGSMSTVVIDGVRSASTSAPSIPLPSALDGVQILLDGVPVPLYSVDKDQIRFQAPYALRMYSEPTVTIRQNSQTVLEFTTRVEAVNPGILPYEGMVKPVLVHSADFSPVDETRPADRGEYITFYASGIGAVTNPPATGDAAPLDRLAPVVDLPQVTIGGVPCEVQFAGLAPGFVGIFQVNVRVNVAVSSGERDLVLITPGATSDPVKIQVR